MIKIRRYTGRIKFFGKFMDKQITILSKEGCYWCEKLDKFLNENEIEHNKLYLGKDFSRLYWEITYPFYNEFPLIIVDNSEYVYASFIDCWKCGFFKNGYFPRETIKMTCNDTRMLDITEYNELMEDRQELIKSDFKYCTEAGENAKIPKHNSDLFMSKTFNEWDKTIDP